MADAMKQSNCFKLKPNPVNIFVLGVLYSTGLFSTQAVGSTTDITGQTITDGVLVDTPDDIVNINGGSKISNASDKNSVMIDLTSSDPTKGATLNVSGQGTTISGGKTGINVATSKGSVVNVTDNVEVSGSEYGIIVRNNKDGNANAKINIDHATISGGMAVFVWEASPTIGTSSVDISDSTLIATGGNTSDSGLKMGAGYGAAHINNSTIISDSRGVYASSFAGTIDIVDSTINAAVSGLRLINSVGCSYDVSNSIITSDDTGLYYDINNKNTTVTLSKGTTLNGGKYGIYTVDSNDNENNIINVDDSTVQSAEGNGVSLGGGFTLNVNNHSLVDGENAIVLNGDTAGSTVNVKDSTVTGKTNLLQISGTSAVDTVGFAGSTLSGAITTSSGADQSVNIDSSAWTGSAGKTGTGALALNISNGSTWINNAATDVNAISLTGGSTIVMDGGNIHTASLSDSAPTTLLAASPTASTIYSTYNAETGSAFVLTADKATGSFNAGVTSSSSGAAGDMTGNTIVQVTDGSGATFNSMQSDVGVYRYESRSVANADGSTSVILDDITPEPTPDPAPGPNPNPNPDSRTLSTAAQAVVNTRAAAMSIWSDEQDVLNRRLDNERLTGSSDGTVNAWGSYYGGYHRQQVEQTSSAYDQTNNGFMLGADKRVDIAPGNLLFGFAAARGYSDVNMHDGGSAGTDVDSYGASLYTSLRLNNGLFFDASIKGTHLKNDISVTSLDGGHTTGDYNNNGFGGAFKTGYHKQFNAWYIEPYAQISYARYNSVDYKLKNGLHTKDDGSTSLGLEGGVNVGTAMALNNGTEVRPYVHLAVAGETENSNTMDINGEKINDSTDGSRGIVGLGADVKLSKNLSGWAGANYAKGQDHYESPWQLNAGVSYTW